MIICLPSPLDVPPSRDFILRMKEDEYEELVRHSDDNEPLSALAFKIVTDPYVGKPVFPCLFWKDGIRFICAKFYKGKRERIGRILQMHANHRQEITTAYAGDIAAAVGLKLQRQVIRFVMKLIQSSWSRWNFLSLLLMLP